MSGLQVLIGRMPKFMHPELDRVETIEDLEYQVGLECDLGEAGDTDPRWSKAQLHQAKMYVSHVHIQSLKAKHIEALKAELNDRFSESIFASSELNQGGRKTLKSTLPQDEEYNG